MSTHHAQDEFQIFYCGTQNHITFLVSISGHCSPPQPFVLLYTYIPTYLYIYIGFPNGSWGKEFAYNAADTRDMVPSLDQEDPPKEEMAIHSSILAWRTPWAEEPGRLESKGSQRIGPNWAQQEYISIHTHTHTHKTDKNLPIPIFLPFSGWPCSSSHQKGWQFPYSLNLTFTVWFALTNKSSKNSAEEADWKDLNTCIWLCSSWRFCDNFHMNKPRWVYWQIDGKMW